jgi:hypothetical protein
MMNRLLLMKLHALLAAFILPVAIMFIVTGALYTWGIKGSYTNATYEIPLSKPLKSDATELTDLARLELKKLDTRAPEGQPQLKVNGEHFVLEWSGSSKDMTLEPTKNPLVAKLTVKNTSWYRNLVQLHKAKGGIAFKIYAAVFAISMLILLVSGFIMAWQTPKLKRSTLITALGGIGSFIIFVYLS